MVLWKEHGAPSQTKLKGWVITLRGRPVVYFSVQQSALADLTDLEWRDLGGGERLFVCFCLFLRGPAAGPVGLGFQATDQPLDALQFAGSRLLL